MKGKISGRGAYVKRVMQRGNRHLKNGDVISGDELRAMPAANLRALISGHIDSTEPNVFPVIEKIDARDSGRDAEVILATKIEGQLTYVTVKLSYQQAGDLWVQLEPFRHSKRGTT